MANKPFSAMTPFGILPACVLPHLRVGLFATLYALASFLSAPTDEPVLRHKQIAERRGRSPHTTRKQLYALRDMGLIEMTPVVRDGEIVACRYRICYGALLALAEAPVAPVAPVAPPAPTVVVREVPDAIDEPPPDPEPPATPPDVPETDVRASNDRTLTQLDDRIRRLARAWWIASGATLDVKREMLTGEHTLSIFDRHPDGRVKSRAEISVAQFIAKALKDDAAYADLRRRTVARAIRKVAHSDWVPDPPTPDERLV